MLQIVLGGYTARRGVITVHQDIGFCRSDDGVRLAFAATGTGPPLVKVANYLTHLQHDWTGPVWEHWLRALSRDHRLIRYDERGCGLSDRTVAEISLEAWVEDLRAVVDALRLDRFPLLGISQGAAVAVAYAVAHPHRVSRLVLYGGYARGRFRRAATSDERLRAETMINAIRVGWGAENPAFRQLFSTMLMPDGSEQQWAALNELARLSTSAEIAATVEEACDRIDVTEAATQVTAPTLVLHATGDARTPVEEGRLLGGLIPGARFVPLESRNHVLLEHEPAWTRFLGEVRPFLAEDVASGAGAGAGGGGGAGGGAGAAGDDIAETANEAAIEAADRLHGGRAAGASTEALRALTRREREVLAWVGTGISNEEIAERLHISPKTARNHVSRVYAKLHVHRRAQAVVLAREAGLQPVGSAATVDGGTSR